MNNDGFGQSGAGPSDMRVAGSDLQHNRQTRTADETPGRPIRMQTEGREKGGPMKQHLDEERARHNEGMNKRLDDLERHYSRMPNSQYTNR